MDKEQNKKEEKKVTFVESKPIELKAEDKKTGLTKVSNIRIDRIGSLTLNIFAQPLKKRYEKHYRENKIHLLIDIVLAVIIIILIGVILNLWLFSRTKLVNLVDFKIVSSPENLVNGQETTFVIDYENTTSDTLADVSLVLKKPEALKNTIYEDAGFDLKTNTLKIGELAPKAHGQFKIKGLLLGNLNDSHEFLAVINYKNKFGQERQEFFSQNFQLTSSALAAEIVLPERIIATSPFDLKINLKNNSSLDFSKLKIKTDWPENFSFEKSSLAKTEGDNLWLFGNLLTEQSADCSFQGKIYINQPQNANFSAKIYDVFEGQEYLLAQTSGSAFIDFSKFKINLINLDKNHSVAPGGEAAYTLFYQNEENYAVSNVELGLNLSGDYTSQKTYRLNQNNFPWLAKIEPGQEGSVEIKVPIKTSIDYQRGAEGRQKIEVLGFASYDDPLEKSRLSVESPATSTLISSRLSLNTIGLFFTPQGDQIGVGSIPPTVGEYTAYWAIIRLTNAHHPIKDLKITAHVPQGIEFTDIYNVTDGNQIIFDQNSRTLTWSINNISSFAGMFNPAPEARIQLAITPTASQAGTSPALLTNITATATDEITGAFLTATSKNITTAIFNDENLNKVVE